MIYHRYRHQRQLSLIKGLALLFACSWGAVQGQTSKTFFMPRTPLEDAVLERAVTHNFINDNASTARLTVSKTGFYQESVNSGELARYFFPNNKNELVIKGSQAGGDAPDISGTWLQIAGTGTDQSTPGIVQGIGLYLNTYESKISIRPTVRSFGVDLQMHKVLGCISKKLWLSLTAPFMQMETDANLKEYDVKNAVASRSALLPFTVEDAAPANTRLERATLGNQLSAIEAFNNPFWKYGKIKNGNQKLAGLADLKLNLGYDFVQSESYHFSMYPSVIFPTGYKPRNEFAFEPMIGNGRHFAFGGGATFDFKFLDCDQRHFTFGTNVEYHYLFRSTERRSFDLIPNGQWSRYLLVFEPLSDQFTPKPGINFFTKPLYVTPQSEVNWLSSLHYHYHNFFIETGYNMWWKDSEKVSLRHAWDEKVAIAHIEYGGVDPASPFALQSAPTAVISQATNATTPTANAADSEADPTTNTVLVNAADLNLKSAAHPARMTHKVFLALGGNGECYCKPVGVAFGGAYEFADKNSALEQWSVWMKLQMSL